MSRQIRSDKSLSEREEQLIMAGVDGECGFWQKLRLRKLLASNEEAVRFFEAMQWVSKKTKDGLAAVGSGSVGSGLGHRPVDLWFRVSKRIQEEEKHAVLLGKRDFELGGGGKSWFGAGVRRAPVWAMAGVAAVAVGLSIFPQIKPLASNERIADLVGPSDNSSAAYGGSVANASSPKWVSLLSNHSAADRDPQANWVFSIPQDGSATATQGLSLSRTRNFDLPIVLEDEQPRVLEVDWMKSRGRVKVMPDANNGAPILWVNRGSSRRLALLTPIPGSVLSVEALNRGGVNAQAAFGR